MPEEIFVHPKSGRSYKEGDPAHTFARYVSILARQCDSFLYHHNRRMQDEDYLQQDQEWDSDPGSIAQAMAATLAKLDQAHAAVRVDRLSPQFGFRKDEDWGRKYGPVQP